MSNSTAKKPAAKKTKQEIAKPFAAILKIKRMRTEPAIQLAMQGCCGGGCAEPT